MMRTPLLTSFLYFFFIVASPISVWSLPTSDHDLRQAISQTAEILATQNSNIVLEFNSIENCWLFRRGSIRIKIPENIAYKLGQPLAKKGINKILISLHDTESKTLALKLKKALFQIIIEKNADVNAILMANDIKSFSRFKSVVLIPAYGDAEGRPLNKALIEPAKGVESLAQQMNRTIPDIDARVYNPNLTSINEMIDFLKHEKPDLIGMNVFETVLERSTEITGRLHLELPESTLIWGGPTISHAPFANILESLPIHGISTDNGQSLIKIAKQLQPSNPEVN